MDVVPVSVGTASRAWDEQHLEIASAAKQVQDAPRDGFTSAVSGPASRFVTEWQRHLTTTADQAEAHADGLRKTIQEYLLADGAADRNWVLLQSYLTEVR